MAGRLEQFSSAIIALAGLAIGGVAVHREFGGGPQRAAAAPRPKTLSYADGWEQLRAIGSWVGDSSAKVTLVEFADFECPYCRRFHEEFVKVQETFGKDVALLFVHYPLKNHRFAKPAIVATQCAEAQGKFAGMHDAIFSKQDSLGLKSWSSFAADAQVPDVTKFESCVKGGMVDEKISLGIAFADSMHIGGTPTVLFNGWLAGDGVPDSLEQKVRAILAGKPMPGTTGGGVVTTTRGQ